MWYSVRKLAEGNAISELQQVQLSLEELVRKEVQEDPVLETDAECTDN